MMVIIKEATNISSQMRGRRPVPKLVPPFRSFVKVAMVGAIEHVEPIENIFTSMGMDDVEENGDAKSMGGINKLHQFLWGT